MNYSFIHYIYVVHVWNALFMLGIGLVLGIRFSQQRRKKFYVILLYAVLLLCLIYPITQLSSFAEYREGILECKSHPDYVLYEEVCYKYVSGYIPYSTTVLKHPESLLPPVH